jgi:hypothetical protein
VHESRPLFEKSRDVYRTMSKRFSSRMSNGMTLDMEASLAVDKEVQHDDDVDSRHDGNDDITSVAANDSFELNKIPSEP